MLRINSTFSSSEDREKPAVFEEKYSRSKFDKTKVGQTSASCL